MDASLGDLRIANQHVFQQKEKRERKKTFFFKQHSIQQNKAGRTTYILQNK